MYLCGGRGRMVQIVEEHPLMLEVNGGTKRERELVERAVEFSIKYLMPRKRKLYLEVDIVKLEGDVTGFHNSDEKYEHHLEINKGMPEEELLSTVFHEMVHVRQMERGELKDKGLIKVWKGEEHLHIYSSHEDYMDLPWEKEAYDLQEKMLVSFYNK